LRKFLVDKEQQRGARSLDARWTGSSKAPL
jgi:hypothetical protein